MSARVWCGLDRIDTADSLLRGRRIGLMTNPTGITHDFQSAIDIVAGRYRLAALFACEHGIRGDEQAGDKVETYQDKETGAPVYSTYGANGHRLTEEMLDAFDVLVFDMQDVGVRFYTYLYSLSYAMEACARAGKPVVVLDRLNPISAGAAEGIVLDKAFASFVGDYALPTRYGLTIGEYALYVKDYLKLDLDLTVIPMEGYSRRYFLDDTDTPWVAPSPNCATLHTALCYIGACIFEGTNISEGRGTTLPFEMIGAPWLDAASLERSMRGYETPGIRFRRASFVPQYAKHKGERCYGVQMHVVDRCRMAPVEAALYLMDAIREQNPERFAYITWEGHYFLDKLLGTDAYRAGEMSASRLIEAHRPRVAAFAERAKAFHLYSE